MLSELREALRSKNLDSVLRIQSSCALKPFLKDVIPLIEQGILYRAHSVDVYISEHLQCTDSNPIALR